MALIKSSSLMNKTPSSDGVACLRNVARDSVERLSGVVDPNKDSFTTSVTVAMIGNEI